MTFFPWREPILWYILSLLGSLGGPPLFTFGMEVLVRKENAFFYGTIKKVDEYHKRCRVSFGDGAEEAWASFKVMGIWRYDVVVFITLCA